MSEALFLVNPHKLKRRKKSRKGRMPAGLRRYWASKRRGRKVKSRRRRRHAAVAAAPRRRRRRHHSMGGIVKRRRKNPIRHSRRKHRRQSVWHSRNHAHRDAGGDWRDGRDCA